MRETRRLKRVQAASRRSLVRLNLTPMIDVTFQLILFFLLAGHMVQQETQLDLDLPPARTGEKAAETNLRRVIINVTPEGSILISGQALTIDRLGALLSAEYARGDALEVRIRADRRTKYRYVAPILVACARCHIWNVSFAVISGDDVSLQ